MKNSILITLSIFLFFTSCGDIPFDTSERGGVMMATDDKTIIIENLAKAYTEGNFDMAKDYFAEGGVHYVNNDEYTNDEVIAGYNFHSLLYDEMEHLTPWVTTMYYNDGSIYTNQWAEWTGKSKITGEVQTNNFHCWWKWEGDKIVSTACYFDTTDIDKEAALYAEQSK